MRVWLLALLLLSRVALADALVHARIDRDVLEYELHADFSYVLTQTTERTLLTRRGLQAMDRSTFSFAPDQQSVAVVEAWVDQTDGSRVKVPDGAIFTRPSQEAQAAPGFLNTVTTTVLFPQLREGSRTHVVWRVERKRGHRLGFNYSYQAWYEWDAAVQETILTLPAAMALRWAVRGDVAVEDTEAGGMRRIVARMPASARQDVEPAMVSTRDFLPAFLATTLPGPEAIGAILYRDSAGTAEVTPEIATLAARVTGERTGEDAARALHAWVAANIRYIAVSLNTASDYIPHKAADVLKAGYGDSRDFVVLMQALLAARGVEAVAALVDAGTRYADPPLITPAFADHEMLYLPAFDRWVNPVDRTARFEGLERRLSGKLAVLITPEGKVTHTPASTPEGHRYGYYAKLALSGDGLVRGTARYDFAPAVESGVRRALSNTMSMSALAADLLGASGESGFGGFAGSDPRDLLQPLVLTSRWDSPGLMNREGSEVFLSVPLGLDLSPPFSQRGKLSPGAARRTPVLADASDLRWENEIVLPAGMKVASVPPDVAVETPAGRYVAIYRATDGGITVARHLVIFADVVPAEGYSGLRTLLYAALVDARAVLVLRTAAEE